MNKATFIQELRASLKGLPESDIEERVAFYNEAIDDRIEDGKSEEEAVSEMGSIDDIIKEIAETTSLVKLVKHKTTPKRKIRPWEIVMLVLGFPLWFPLLIVALVLLFVGYLLVWIVDLVFWVIDLSFASCFVVGIVAFFTYNFNFGYLGISLFGAGLAILCFFGCVAFTKLSAKFTKRSLIGIKTWFITGGKNE